MSAWVRLYFGCHSYVMGSPVLSAWPDGRPVLEQPAITVRMFEVIAGEVRAEQEQEAQRNSDANSARQRY